MRKLRLLDLFSGAGGAAMGYHQAGFTEIVGVDLAPQPRYPFEFVQGGALEFLRTVKPGDFDLIHASPPCQAYTAMRGLGKGAGKDAPDLVRPVRAALRETGTPYVIENVPGAPMDCPFLLCGSSFGLGVRRHRLFETPMLVMQLPCAHRSAPRPVAVYGDHPQTPGDGTFRVNRARTLAEGQTAMGIDWMPWKSLTQAIPPAYTRFLGEQLIRQLA